MSLLTHSFFFVASMDASPTSLLDIGTIGSEIGLATLQTEQIRQKPMRKWAVSVLQSNILVNNPARSRSRP